MVTFGSDKNDWVIPRLFSKFQVHGYSPREKVRTNYVTPNTSVEMQMILSDRLQEGGGDQHFISIFVEPYP